MKNKVPYFFLALAAVLAVAAVVLYVTQPKRFAKSEPPEKKQTTAKIQEVEIPLISDGLDLPTPTPSAEEILANLGLGLATVDPADLVNQISDALKDGDMDRVSKLIGKDAINAKTFALLNALAKHPHKIREVGEIELNKRTRWALELGDDDTEKQQIHFDLQFENGRWRIGKISVPDTQPNPEKKASTTDPLNLADAFLQAVLKQNFEVALQWVDLKSVSETKIAALCILFEEGEYKMRENKPLRAVLQREDIVGYLVNIETKDSQQTAQFSLSLSLDVDTENWRVSEINLDQLLADYASRVAGGDIYYSPLVKNPAGGETLALYFEFNEDSISPRTRRQLEIVASILKSDSNKKITLSGHTDALGTKTYNDQLSANRADVVRDFLSASGVSADQIITIAKGASQPRRPNITETGEDNPDGRRANRRTEIYLDF